MQIYTRVGDKGETKTIGGKTVFKDDARVEAYGTIDELNSFIGLARVKVDEIECLKSLSEELLEIQHLLFDCGNDIATPAGDERYSYRTGEKAVEWLEARIDEHAKESPEIKTFILPGGSETSAMLHVCRTICRRAERRIVTFMQIEATNPYALKFINRLSDYLFAIARSTNAKLNQKDVAYERGGDVFHLDIGKEDIFD